MDHGVDHAAGAAAMSLLAKLFGLNLPAWVVEVAAAAAIAATALLWFAHHERGIELAKLQKSGRELEAKVEKANAATTAAYEAGSKSNQEKLDAAHHDVDAVSSQRDAVASAFALWVRQHPGSNPDPGVARPPGQPAAAGNGECGPRSCADLAVQLVQDGDNLARDLGLVTADLYACQRDRDSLTGLPR